MGIFHIEPQVVTALLLTGLGAAGTALGGLMVVVQPKLSFKKLGYMQGVAAGLMMFISFFDLVPESVEAVGTATAHAMFLAGAAFFAIVVALIPEPDSLVLAVADDQEPQGRQPHPLASQASPTTGEATPHPSHLTRRRSPRLAETPGPGDGKGTTVGGDAAREARQRVLLSGLITALGIALHNLPEGVAVFLSSLKSARLGLSLAISIALHNIPEGVAVALPVFFATGSRWRGFMYAAVSGLAEPAAVVVLGVLLKAFWIDKMVIDCLLAAVGGIMAFLSLHELLPLAIEHAGRQQAVIAAFVGMAIMAANLLALDVWMGEEGGGH